MERIVVVGASLAGLRACESLRMAGYSGTITLIGAERHEPYDRPPLSKALLKGEWEPDRIRLRKPDDLAGLDKRDLFTEFDQPVGVDQRRHRYALATDLTQGARVVGVIDHHPQTRAKKGFEGLLDFRPGTGATARSGSRCRRPQRGWAR